MTQHINPTSKQLVIYPTMLKENYTWIEALQRVHKDPEINTHPDLRWPHFVIHREKSFETELFIEKVSENIQDIYAFDFIIRYAVIMRDFIPSYKIVLIPMEGLQYFMHLQSLIYVNVLNCKTSPFSHTTPHIHLAWCQHLSDAKVRVNQINLQEIEINGRVDKLTVRERQHDNYAVPIIHEFTLKSRV